MSRSDRRARPVAARPEVTSLEGRRLLTSGFTTRTGVSDLALAAATNRASFAAPVASYHVQMAASTAPTAPTAAPSGRPVVVNATPGSVGLATATPRISAVRVVSSTPTADAAYFPGRIATPPASIQAATLAARAEAQLTAGQPRVRTVTMESAVPTQTQASITAAQPKIQAVAMAPAAPARAATAAPPPTLRAATVRMA